MKNIKRGFAIAGKIYKFLVFFGSLFIIGSLYYYLIGFWNLIVSLAAIVIFYFSIRWIIWSDNFLNRNERKI